jgi:hypothetical protein
MIDFHRSQVSRPITGILSVARCLLPVGICLLALATAAWPQQSAEQIQTTRPIHIVRTIVGPNGLNPLGPSPQSGTAHLGYYGGPVVSNLQVVVVFWGSGVSSVVTGGVGGFFQNITNSTYFDLLSEYASTVPPVSGSGGTSQSIGRGTYGGSFTIAPSICNTTPCTVTDGDLQLELISQISGAHLPPPAKDADGNVNTLYMIYFPPGVRIALDSTTFSCEQFCAYHGTTATKFNSKNLAYGVMPDFGPTSACNNVCGAGNEFQNITSVSSHEMAETVTDVDVGIATVFAPPLAWYDPLSSDKDGGGEIGDICNGQESAVTTPGGTYTVQQIWSNQANACVSIGSNPIFQLSAPSTAASGTSFNFTVTAKNPVDRTIDTSFAGVVHFTSSDSQAVLPAEFTFTPSDLGTQTFGATLRTSGAQTITATDTVNNAIAGTATVTVGGGGNLGGLTFTPTSLIYGNQAIGTTSVIKKVTLTNSAGGTVSIASIVITGTNPGDFAKTATTCVSILAANKSCTVSVTFTPGALGARSATLVITDAATNSPQQIALSGKGVVQVSVTPSALSFGGITVGSTSVAKVITVKNNLKTTLTFSGTPFTFTGSDPGDFGQSATTCGSTLVGLGHCTVSIVFAPTAPGVLTAVLNVADSGNSSPQTVNLSGTGK